MVKIRTVVCKSKKRVFVKVITKAKRKKPFSGFVT
jgi:hypothetical protein